MEKLSGAVSWRFRWLEAAVVARRSQLPDERNHVSSSIPHVEGYQLRTEDNVKRMRLSLRSNGDLHTNMATESIITSMPRARRLVGRLRCLESLSVLRAMVHFGRRFRVRIDVRPPSALPRTAMANDRQDRPISWSSVHNAPALRHHLQRPRYLPYYTS